MARSRPDRPPEVAFAARVPPPAPERPQPAGRRVIFFDVENTSRAEHIARMIGHLAIDRSNKRTDFVAVGNWRVIGSDTARLLARHGAQLVHSAPSTGVRDWSDLRIAVSAGVWLAGARAGDMVEIVSDDRAFDAVGDVAATLGVQFRRLSYRTLAGAPASLPVEEEVAAEPRGRRGRHGRGRGRRGPAAPHHAPHHVPVHEPPAAARPAEPAAEDAHTAPHDEIVSVVRELADRTGGRPVLLDTLANALKDRGFRRPPGSPRLITRLRRIRELSVSPTGMITLVAATDGGAPLEAEPLTASAAEPADAVPGSGRRRRRSRRGGRRRRRHGGAPPPDAA
jgi:hypothetical protein